MFKKAADNVHFIDRTGSHATKGSPTGLVDQRKLDETDFYSDAVNMARWNRMKDLRKERKPLNTAYWGIIELLKTCEDKGRRNLTDTLKLVRKRLRVINLELAELASVTRKPPSKVKQVFSSRKERRAYKLKRRLAKALA